jgi:GTP1/Obg family GTP-binding protein
MKAKVKSLIVTIIGISIFFIGQGIAFSASDYDDVYENEIDKDTDLNVENITKEDLRAFVKAANEIAEIRSEYARRILNEGDKTYGTLRNEAVDRMVEAIEVVGLDEETYRGIAYHVDKDEDILSKIY